MIISKSVKKLNNNNTTFRSANYEDNKKYYDNIIDEVEIEIYDYLHYRPNSLNPYQETITYNTDRIEAYDGTEQRIPLLIQPRNKFSYYYTLDNKNLRDFNSFLFKNQSKVIKIPVWSEITFLNRSVSSIDTILFVKDINYRRFNVNTEFVLVNHLNYADYQFINIEGVDKENNLIWNSSTIGRDWPAGTIMMPVVKVFFKDNINKVMTTDRLSNFELEMTILADDSNIISESTVIYDKYKDMYVLSRQPDKSTDITQLWQRKIMMYDLGYGKQDWIDKQDKPFLLYDYKFKFFTKKEIGDFKTFINKLAGSLKEFWMPTFEYDLRVIPNLAIAGNVIMIENNNNYLYNLKRNYIMIKLKNGTELFSRINIEQVDLTRERILLSDFTLSINSNEIDYISFLNKVRFNSDEFVFSYYNDEMCEISKTVYIQY